MGLGPNPTLTELSLIAHMPVSRVAAICRANGMPPLRGRVPSERVRCYTAPVDWSLLLTRTQPEQLSDCATPLCGEPFGHTGACSGPNAPPHPEMFEAGEGAI